MSIWVSFIHFLSSNLYPFLNSNFFIALVTGIAGGTAIWLYRKQKSENKQQIATLLIGDIRNAYAAIQAVKDSIKNNLIPEIVILPENNWKKFSYLFSKDLDQDETYIINKFFSDAERIGEVVKQANDMFLTSIGDRDRAIQNANLTIISNSKTIPDARKKLAVFDLILNDPGISVSPYTPSGFYTKLNNYLPDVQDILNTSAGLKLKMIAKVRF